MELCFKLPFPPSVNNYKKVGRIVKTKSGKLYQQRVDTNETKRFYFDVYMLTKQNIPPEWAKLAEDETINYELKVYLYPPNNKRYDIDNPLKVLIDGLMHAHIFKDDSQITRLYVEKMTLTNQGETVVRIIQLDSTGLVL